MNELIIVIGVDKEKLFLHDFTTEKKTILGDSIDHRVIKHLEHYNKQYIIHAETKSVNVFNYPSCETYNTFNIGSAIRTVDTIEKNGIFYMLVIEYCGEFSKWDFYKKERILAIKIQNFSPTFCIWDSQYILICNQDSRNNNYILQLNFETLEKVELENLKGQNRFHCLKRFNMQNNGYCLLALHRNQNVLRMYK